jgi:hypothetical protein
MFSLNLFNTTCLVLGICLTGTDPIPPPSAIDLQHCQRRTPDCLRRETLSAPRFPESPSGTLPEAFAGPGDEY